MTAIRKVPARRPRPRPELRMPYFYCTRPDCTYEFQPTGDYSDTAIAAGNSGWLYVQGTGWLCPGDTGYVPWWPQPAGRLALPAPDVPRPGPTVSAVEGAMPVNAPGPGDTRILPTVRIGGVHLTLDPEPLPDGEWTEQQNTTGVKPLHGSSDSLRGRPGQPDATASFAVTGETQPIGRPHPDHGKPFTDLEQEMARLDDAEDIQP